MPEIICDDNGTFVGIKVRDELYDLDGVEDLVRERQKIGESYINAMRCAKSLYDIMRREGFELPNHERRYPWLLTD